MNIFLNYGLAWVSTLFVIILSAKFFIRKGVQLNNSLKPFMVKLNRLMKYTHIYIGVLLIITGLVHGLYSSTSVLSWNIGTISWILSILLGVNWMIRKFMKNRGIWMNYHRILTIIFVTTIVCHVGEVGGIQIFNILNSPNENIIYEATTDEVNDNTSSIETTPNSGAKENQNNTVQPESTPNNTDSKGSLNDYNKNLMGVVFKDGTYSGEATGYRPGLTVSVVVKSNLIKKITITSHNEVNSRFYSRPISIIPQSIIDNQTLDINTISGATFTSIGILNSVNDALSQSLVSGELPKMLSLPVMRGKVR